MIPRRIAWLLSAGVKICSLTVACTRQASTAPVAVPSQSAPHIGIRRVQVTQGTGIYILGETDLPDGECIQTELLAEKRPEAWWPRDVCIQVESGQWEILVSLGRRGAPVQLDEEIQYEIHAWWLNDAQATSIYFPFDLSGPPKTD